MNKLQLEPGRKYRGSAWLNEYGEIQFRPEQKGSKPGNLKLVVENEMFSLYESKKKMKVMMNFEKSNFDIATASHRFLFVASTIKQYIKGNKNGK